MVVDGEAARRKIKLAIEATSKGKVFFSKNNYIDEFNHGCDHVASLLESAFHLYQLGFYPTSAFISITAIEEIVKLEIAIYRHEGRTEPVRHRRQDYLFSHKKKHSIALQETIAIGTRLSEVIGEERVRELLTMEETGRLVEIREKSLYFDTVNGKFTIPSDVVSKLDSRDLLLLALTLANNLQKLIKIL
jgi:AbiV family abortive infection protein